jgi:hypothetical protein
MRPLAIYKFKKSWVYRHGYHVVRRSNPHLVFWVCHRCYRTKATDQGRGILQTTKAISTALCHLELHKIYKPGKAPTEKPEVLVYGKLISSKQRVSQVVTNKVASFNYHEFQKAAVGWLLENNHSISEFESPAFRNLIRLANPLVEDALRRSHHSVLHYVVHLFDYLKPLVVFNTLANGLGLGWG